MTSIHKLKLDELTTSYLTYSKDIKKLWGKEVFSKVALGEVIWDVEMTRNNFVAKDEAEVKTELERYNAFIKSLPFESSSYKKYMNIGKNKDFLVSDIGVNKLPNDYNILYTITSDKVMKDKAAKDAVIKNLKPNSTRDDVSKMINKPKDPKVTDIITDCSLATIKVNSKSFVKETFVALMKMIDSCKIEGADIDVSISSIAKSKIEKDIADKWLKS